MANNLNVIPNNFILSSAESVRKKILDRLVEYEELQGVDLSKATFLSYIVDTLSMLSADNSNAISLSKRESYLVTATLPSSIYNWASYLSYTKGFAKPSTVDALLSIPLIGFTHDVTFYINPDTQFKADNIIYTNPVEKYTFDYKESNNTLTVTASTTTTHRNVNVIIRDNIAYLVLPLIQVVKENQERYIPYDLKVYQPYSFTVQYSDKLSDIKVYVKSDANANEEEWQRADSYFNMGIGEKKYYFNYDSNNTVRIMFGNDIFGRQPDPGSIVRIEFYETKADKGAIIPGSLTKMSKINYTDSNGRIKAVTINVTNVIASTTGVTDESLDETRRKAIARFQARQRIVTSYDHDQIKDIVATPLPYDFSKSILKRSDLKSNEVILYVVIPDTHLVRNPEAIVNTQEESQSLTQTIPVPTSSLSGEIPSDTTQFMPYKVFTEDDIEYVCPLGFIKETDSFGYYFYLVNDASVTPEVTIPDQVTYPLSFTKLEILTNSDYSEITFTLDYYNLDDVVDMNNIDVNMFMQYSNDSKGPYHCTIDIENSKIIYSVPMEDIRIGNCNIQYQVKDITNNFRVATVNVNYTLKKELRNYIYSNISTNQNTNISKIYDIPCIKKSYMDNLSTDEKINFETNIIQKLVANNSLDDYRMMNVSINIKFARTCGYSKNYDLNVTTKAAVIDIVNTPPVDAQEGNRFIVGETPTGEFIGNNGKVAMYSNGSWYFLDSAPGDIIYVVAKDKKYTYSGNANYWFTPKFEIPYKISVYVYVNSESDNESVVAQAVKNQILYVLAKYSDIQLDQHRSLMYQAIQQLGSYVDHCEIKIPEVDIVYNYDIDKFTKEQLKEYVPEYIYTDEEHIQVKVIKV